jgi:hypothetical protein
MSGAAATIFSNITEIKHVYPVFLSFFLLGFVLLEENYPIL